MNTFHRHLFTAVAVASLAACSSVKLDDKAPVESRSGAGVVPGSGTGGAGAGSNQTRVAPVDVTPTANVAYSNLPRIVYFDFDSYVVKDEYKPMIEAHGRYLQANRNARMTIQGSTDERGSREYNIALGQRRADALKKLLLLYGATEVQIETVSFGKEKPRREGHDEATWAENRRDEIVFVGE